MRSIPFLDNYMSSISGYPRKPYLYHNNIFHYGNGYSYSFVDESNMISSSPPIYCNFFFLGENNLPICDLSHYFANSTWSPLSISSRNVSNISNVPILPTYLDGKYFVLSNTPQMNSSLPPTYNQFLNFYTSKGGSVTTTLQLDLNNPDSTLNLNLDTYYISSGSLLKNGINKNYLSINYYYPSLPNPGSTLPSAEIISVKSTNSTQFTSSKVRLPTSTGSVHLLFGVDSFEMNYYMVGTIKPSIESEAKSYVFSSKDGSVWKALRLE